LLALALSSQACIEPLPSGEYGTFRYVGRVRGSTPLLLFPPIADRAGNAYVLYGDEIGLLETQLFVGHAEGGWSGGCKITYGNDFGAHGFVGRGEERAWYWSGEALVRSSGRTGGCRRLLEFDPASGARLNFRAVVPWVRETPSTTTLLAWVQSPTDRVPYQVVVDLDVGVYTSVREFSPRQAEDLVVLGTGGDRLDAEGVIVVRYRIDTDVRTEARFIDKNGDTVDTEKLPAMDGVGEYGIQGFLQRNADGLYAGVDSEGQLLVFDRSGGQRKTVSAMTPVGVHVWDGKLWLVGTDNGKPVVASIDDSGDIGSVKLWQSSLDAASELGSEIDVIDDRSLPSTETTWKNPRTALGPFPFVHAHTLDHYADGTTTWLVAGPSFTVAGGEERTVIAHAPVGVSYP
jgi:hypothetical protein